MLTLAIVQIVTATVCLAAIFSGISHSDSIAMFRQLRAGAERTELMNRHRKFRTIWFSIAAVAGIICLASMGVNHV